ncbi:phage tail sheath C-terminal domain-containing protein [Selenomonas ruminantium]|nr:phage tail sheath C-terminal domain-containing protein [Selenomonas ruminantium]
MPSVIVTFKELGIAAIERSQHGTIAMVLPNDPEIDGKVIYTVDDIPEKALDYSKEQIKLALIGYQTTPRSIRLFNIAPTVTTVEQPVLDENGEPKKDEEGNPLTTTTSVTSYDYTQVERRLESAQFDWLVVPGIAPEKVQEIATWIKGMRTNKDRMVKAVLPHCAADHESVVNFTNDVIKTKDGKNYSTADYCARIAGIICGTPATISCTYAPLPEVIECDQFTKEEMDNKVDQGELFFYGDGRKVKIARGINSFVTTVQGKGEDYRKIKLVDLLDMIHDDIVKTGHDSYVGKYANSLDNRMLLVTAINGYFHQLETEGLLERNQNNANIDIEAVRNWRESNGLNTRAELMAMKDQDIAALNIHDNVFIKAELSPLDAIENITVNCNIQ